MFIRAYLRASKENHVTVKSNYKVYRTIFEISDPKNITELTGYKSQRIIDAHYGYS